MNRLATSVLSAALLLLTGCISPRYQRPNIPVPLSYRSDTAAPGAPSETSNLGELRWPDLIHDEELSKLIQEALAHNYDIQIAAARVLEARGQLTVARSARFPSVNAQAGYNNLRTAAGGATPLPPGYPQDSDYSNLSVSLGWELDIWGQIRNASVAARANLLASEQARRAVVQTLVSDVAGAYFLLRDLDLEIEITQRDLKLREASLDLVRLRVDNGYSSEIDLREAEVLVKSARTALTGLELQNEQTENQLAILLGRNPGPIVRGRSLVEQGTAPRVPPGLPSTLLDRRPDIRQAEEQLIANHALVAVAKAAFFPTLSLTASTGFESAALLNLLRASNGMWLLNPAGSLPIFNAGAIRAGVRIAEARRQQAVLIYQQTVQQAFREVADSLAGCRKLAELRTQQEGLVESLRASVAVADLRYQGGVASYLEYLDSERQLLNAQLLLVQVRRQELTNVVTLYRSLGGGWQ
ncbi:MAG TPA: efflux transporter outer membrane subunit [Bryobacteraceae bacterium]|nr:efflux transporter outer membrane subunit [Bryobacteraceae bacterium]